MQLQLRSDPWPRNSICCQKPKERERERETERETERERDRDRERETERERERERDPILITKKRVQDDTRFLKRLEMSGGHGSIHQDTEGSEQVAVSLLRSKESPPDCGACPLLR